MSAATSNVSNELPPPLQILFELFAPGQVAESGDGNIPLLQTLMNSETVKKLNDISSIVELGAPPLVLLTINYLLLKKLNCMICFILKFVC